MRMNSPIFFHISCLTKDSLKNPQGCSLQSVNTTKHLFHLANLSSFPILRPLQRPRKNRRENPKNAHSNTPRESKPPTQKKRRKKQHRLQHLFSPPPSEKKTCNRQLIWKESLGNFFWGCCGGGGHNLEGQISLFCDQAGRSRAGPHLSNWTMVNFFLFFSFSPSFPQRLLTADSPVLFSRQSFFSFNPRQKASPKKERNPNSRISFFTFLRESDSSQTLLQSCHGMCRQFEMWDIRMRWNNYL